MDNIVEEAKAEMGSGNVAYSEFVLDFKKDSQAIYCFYEGKEDRSYYSFRVKTVHKNVIYFDYVCNGKDNVSKVNYLMKNHESYSISKVGYFIDRDFDPENLNKEIYSTPYYSVENFFIVDDAFENILLNEFHISRQHITFDHCIRLFKHCKSIFHNEILLLNAWLACQTDLRIATGSQARLNIDDTIKLIFKAEDFEKMVGADLSSITFPPQLSTHAEIESVFVNAPKISAEVLALKLIEFKGIDPNKVFRGKFELKFLVSFLKRLQDEIGKKKHSIFDKRYACNLRFEYVTSISQLTNNAITPDCLYTYIEAIGDK